MGHKSQEEILEGIKKAEFSVRVGDKYTHFKDPQLEYVVESIGILENTEEVAVCYRALYGERLLWIRTLDDFLAEKEIGGEK